MKIARKSIAVIIILTFALLLGACGPGTQTPVPSATAPEETSAAARDSADVETPGVITLPPAATDGNITLPPAVADTDNQNVIKNDDTSAASGPAAETVTDKQEQPPSQAAETGPSQTPAQTAGAGSPAQTADSGPPAQEPAGGLPAQATDSGTPSPEGPVVLTISGGGVKGETTWTLDQLKALRDGYREYLYSTTNNWPSFAHMTAHGVSLPYLLRQAGVTDSAASFKLIASDGYFFTITREQLFGQQYAFARHSSDGSGGAAPVEPVVAWEWGDGDSARAENICTFFGQNGHWDVNTAAFVRDLCRIEAYTDSAGTWAQPDSSIADGSTVPAGAELTLTHENMDNVRIYYTLDGSEPDYNSPVYNISTSYFQPQLIQPIVLTKSVTVKAFAAAYGKGRSPVAAFNITVQ